MADVTTDVTPLFGALLVIGLSLSPSSASVSPRGARPTLSSSRSRPLSRSFALSRMCLLPPLASLSRVRTDRETKGIPVNEKTKKDLEDAGKHTAHGIEDVADVVGHGVGGAVKGLADGVEAASADSQARKEDAD